MSESKLRGLSHGKNITGQAHQTTDCTDNTDKESEIFVDNKQRRHGDTDTTKHAFSSQFFKIASNSSKPILICFNILLNVPTGISFLFIQNTIQRF